MSPPRIALLASRRAGDVAPAEAGACELLVLTGANLEALERAQPDWVIVAGHDEALAPELVLRFGGRILVVEENTHDAVFRGDADTETTVSLIKADGSRALFLNGPVYPVAHMALDAHQRGDVAFLTQYADLHRRWMIDTSWRDVLTRTLELISGGAIRVVGDLVWIDGAPGPCRMGHSPRECHHPEMMVSRGIPRSCPFLH